MVLKLFLDIYFADILYLYYFILKIDNWKRDILLIILGKILSLKQRIYFMEYSFWQSTWVDWLIDSCVVMIWIFSVAATTCLYSSVGACVIFTVLSCSVDVMSFSSEVSSSTTGSKMSPYFIEFSFIVSKPLSLWVNDF